MRNEKIQGFKGKDPKSVIDRVMARKAGETFIREVTGKKTSRKTERERHAAAVKEGILTALYAQHVLGQDLRLPGMEPPPPMAPPMAPPGMPMDPSMMGMGPPPVDPMAPGMY